MHHLDSFGFYFGHLVWHEDPQISYQLSKDWFTHLLFWIVLVGFPTFADNFSPEDSRTLRWPNPRVNANPSPGPQVFRWRALVLSDVFFLLGGAGQDINSPSDDFDFGLKVFFLVIEQSLSI